MEHQDCPLGAEAETFSKRLRDLEAKLGEHTASCALRNSNADEWRADMKFRVEKIEGRVDAAERQIQKWLGAIAVIAFLGATFGAALASELSKLLGR